MKLTLGELQNGIFVSINIKISHYRPLSMGNNLNHNKDGITKWSEKPHGSYGRTVKKVKLTIICKEFAIFAGFEEEATSEREKWRKNQIEKGEKSEEENEVNERSIIAGINNNFVYLSTFLQNINILKYYLLLLNHRYFFSQMCFVSFFSSEVDTLSSSALAAALLLLLLLASGCCCCSSINFCRTTIVAVWKRKQYMRTTDHEILTCSQLFALRKSVVHNLQSQYE